MRLPICDKDIPCAALKYAYPLSIILSDDNLRPWVAMNYLILCGTKKQVKRMCPTIMII